jgi:hypothetical protein
MIRQFCKGLPKFLSDQLFNEYEFRRRELEFIVEKYPAKYKWIEDIDSIKLLLATSIFYKRVIAQLEAAGKTYYDLIGGQVSAISIGNYNLTENEAGKLVAITSDFYQLLTIFGLNIYLFDYFDTSGFLFKLKKHLENIEGKL